MKSVFVNFMFFSGGVGLAAIRVAFAYGLDVFTTVSTEAKKKFLLKTFPQLKGN